jgi:hypothetical protein
MTRTDDVLTREELLLAANKTLALYYHLFFTRHKRLSSRPDHFAMAFADMLPQRSVQALRLEDDPHIQLLVAEQIPVRIIMQRWITRSEEQRLLRIMARHYWSIGLLLNFGAPAPQLRRFFLDSSS